MIGNKRGAALLQVLIISAVLAGMATMILRATLSRTVSSRQSRHAVSSQMLIESCMAEVNEIWASKTPEAYARDLAACRMCDPALDNSAHGGTCTSDSVVEDDVETLFNLEVQKNQVHKCSAVVGPNGQSRDVYAVMSEGDAGSSCKITWYIPNGIDVL